MTTANLTYVRWRSGEPRRGGVFSAPKSDHPTYGSDCLLCDKPMKIKKIQLVAIGLTDDENAEDEAAAKRGDWYAAGAVIVHHGCAEQLTDEELDLFAAALIPTELLSA